MNKVLIEAKGFDTKKYRDAQSLFGNVSIREVNDYQGYDAVMALLERAISNE